jgi:hypothetical protein
MTAAPPEEWNNETRHVAVEVEGCIYAALCGSPTANFYVWNVADMSKALFPCQDCMAHPDFAWLVLGEL